MESSCSGSECVWVALWEVSLCVSGGIFISFQNISPLFCRGLLCAAMSIEPLQEQMYNCIISHRIVYKITYSYMTWGSLQVLPGSKGLHGYWDDGCELPEEIRKNFPNFFPNSCCSVTLSFLSLQLPGWNFASLSPASFGEVLNQIQPDLHERTVMVS